MRYDLGPGVNSSYFVLPLLSDWHLVSVQKTRSETALPTLWFQFLISDRQLGSENAFHYFISALTDFEMSDRWGIVR